LNSAQLLGRLNTCVSAVIKSPKEGDSGSVVLLDMVEDARVLFEKEGFFFRILERPKKRLKELGAMRIWRRNTWHWN
jgi:hypothetical protein